MRWHFNRLQAFSECLIPPYGPIAMIVEENYVATRRIDGRKHTGIALGNLPAGQLEQADTGKEILFSSTTGEGGALTALLLPLLIPQVACTRQI
jgi:hypothetical protein